MQDFWKGQPFTFNLEAESSPFTPTRNTSNSDLVCFFTVLCTLNIHCFWSSSPVKPCHDPFYNNTHQTNQNPYPKLEIQSHISLLNYRVIWEFSNSSICNVHSKLQNFSIINQNSYWQVFDLQISIIRSIHYQCFHSFSSSTKMENKNMLV